VIGNKAVSSGSFNCSPCAARTNDKTLLVIESPQLAKHFAGEMDQLWRGVELGVTERVRWKLEREQALCGSGSQRGVALSVAIKTEALAN